MTALAGSRWRLADGSSCARGYGTVAVGNGAIRFEWRLPNGRVNVAVERIDSVSGNVVQTTVISDVGTPTPEVGHQVRSDAAVNAVAVVGDTVYCGFDQGLKKLDGFEAFVDVDDAPPGPILKLKTVEGVLYVFSDKAVWALRGDKWNVLATGEYFDVCAFQGKHIIVSETQLFEVKEDSLELLPNAEAPVKMRAIAPFAETLYCMGLDRLMVYDGASIHYERVVDFGTLPSKDVRDILPMDNRLLVATYFGMAQLRGASVTQILGADGLPY